jgi:tetratricopeptide (TPR) repeat protein/tRNA A-37 threonylcarbamoyl transferase component Bud32
MNDEPAPDRSQSPCTSPGGRGSVRAHSGSGSDGASPSQNQARPFSSSDLDLEVARVLEAYLADVEAGRTADPQLLLTKNPEIADRLAACLDVLHFARPVDTGPRRSDGLGSVGDYELLGEVARGGMGVVYRARDRRLNRIVALKMIGEGKQGRPDQRARFLIEAEAVARLRHPNIVQIYDFGEADGRPFVTLEWLEGGSLADRLKGTTLPGRAAAELVATLATAMHAAHQAGIVHRDLKPSNVLFDGDGVPKIADFGLAKRLEVDDGHTVSGQVIGTPSYMAPEQARGQVRQVGPAADIYALGATLYEMLTGRPPFLAPSTLEILHQVAHDDVMPPSRLQNRVARDLETICLKCLQKEPRKRYASALELADDLRRYLANRPIRARRTPLWERGAKWVRRRPATATLTALAVAAVVTLAAAGRNEARRVATVAAESDRELFRAQADVAEKKWADARLILTPLLKGLEREPRLTALHDRAAGLLRQVGQGIEAEARQSREHQRYRLFLERRNEAFFHETWFTGLDLPANVQATRAAARAALGIFAGSAEGDAWTLPALPSSLTAIEQAEIGEGCYELLLVLAEAVAQPIPGEDPVLQAGRGLVLLDRAVRLRPEATRAISSLSLRERTPFRGAKGDIEPATAHEQFLEGRERYKRGEWSAARGHFNAVLRSQPDHFWAQCLAAICTIQTNQHGTAVNGLSLCLQREPGFVWLYLLRGFAASQSAVQARMAGRALQIQDGSFEAGATEQFEAAEADYRKALELLGQEPSEELRYVLLVNRALMRSQRGKLDEAAADFAEAIRLEERYYNAWAGLAQVFQRQKRWDEAVEQFTQAIARKPGWPPLYRGRAAVQIARDDLLPAQRAAALRDLEDAIRFEKPGNPILASDHTDRGELLRWDRRLEEALAASDAALQVRPDYDRAHRLRVLVLLDLKRHDEVLRSCDGALAQGKPWADIHEIRGVARAGRGDFAGAIADYSQALVLRPGQSRVLNLRGLAYLASDAPRLALGDFDDALRLDASSAEAHSGRGLALARLGDHCAAVVAAEESLRHDPASTRRAVNAARIYAQAALAAAAEVTQKGPTAVALVDRYQDRAVALVKRALEQLPAERRAAFWQSQISADPALRPLQRRLRWLQPSRTAIGPVTSGNTNDSKASR